MRTAVLAVIHEEIGVGTVGNCVFARVCVRCPLRHLSPKPLASTPEKDEDFIIFFSFVRFLSARLDIPSKFYFCPCLFLIWTVCLQLHCKNSNVTP